MISMTILICESDGKSNTKISILRIRENKKWNKWQKSARGIEISGKQEGGSHKEVQVEAMVVKLMKIARYGSKPGITTEREAPYPGQIQN